MRWPWVGRRAYEDALARLDKAEARVDKLLKHVTRMDRLEHGAGELAPEEVEPDPMPDHLYQLAMSWGAASTRARMLEEMERLRAKGMTWPKIEQRVVALFAADQDVDEPS